MEADGAVRDKRTPAHPPASRPVHFEGLGLGRAGGTLAGVSQKPGPEMHPKAPAPLVQTFPWHRQPSKFTMDHRAWALSSA